jgi:ABC-type bacteriocin/lantibiotic exporter with double-glycine peptidase domain
MTAARRRRPSRSPAQTRKGVAPRILLKTSSVKQGRALCGPACLRIVAAYFALDISERKLAKACRSSPISGTTGANMLLGARSLGLASAIIDGANFRMIEAWLRRGIPVIVDWMSIGQSRATKQPVLEGHYSVVCGVTKSHIVLEDPGIRRRRHIPRSDFLRAWFDFTHLYPHTKDDLIIRRMIVVGPRNAVSKALGNQSALRRNERND